MELRAYWCSSWRLTLLLDAFAEPKCIWVESHETCKRPFYLQVQACPALARVIIFGDTSCACAWHMYLKSQDRMPWLWSGSTNYGEKQTSGFTTTGGSHSIQCSLTEVMDWMTVPRNKALLYSSHTESGMCKWLGTLISEVVLCATDASLDLKRCGHYLSSKWMTSIHIENYTSK